MEHYHLIIQRSVQELVSLEELLEITGITHSMLDHFLEFGLIEPVASKTGALLFDIGTVPRIRMIQRLRSDIGINLPGIAIILNLKDQIQQLQRELDWYRD